MRVERGEAGLGDVAGQAACVNCGSGEVWKCEVVVLEKDYV